MEKQLTKYALIAFLGLTGIISCGGDEPIADTGTGTDTGTQKKLAVLHIDSETIGFGEITFPNAKELNFVVTNKGNDVLKITSANLTGTNKTEFTTDLSTKNIDAGKSETFKVTFKPTSAGDKTASLELKTNVGDKIITLTGKRKKTLLDKEGFLFSYEFENNLDTTNGDVTGVTLSKIGTKEDYIQGITRDSHALDITGTTLLARNIPLTNSITQISISFWYKSTTRKKTKLLNIVCGDESLRVFKDPYKHFMDGIMSIPSGSFLSKGHNTSNHNLNSLVDWNHVFVSISFPTNNYNKSILFDLYVNGLKVSTRGNHKETSTTLFKNSNKLHLSINEEKEDLKIDNLRIYSKGSTVSESTNFFNELNLQ